MSVAPPIVRNTPQRVSWWGALATIFLAWGLGASGVFSLAIPFLLVPAIIFLALGRRWIALTLAVLLNPLAVHFGLGVLNYGGATPRLVGAGLPGPGYFNLSKTERCYRANTGCIVSGGEWISHGVRNLGLRTMRSLFGPPPNSYSGPYPSESELLSRWPSESRPYAPEHLQACGLELHDVQEVQPIIDANREAIFFDEPAPGEISFVALGQGGLAVRLLQSEDDSTWSYARNDVILLFDLPHHQLFAVYALKGMLAQRRFPVIVPGH